MNFFKAVSVPNQPEGAYYAGKLQLHVPLTAEIQAGDWVKVEGNQYNGIFRVTDTYDNTTAQITALYFGDQYFAGNDSGTLEKLNYNPLAAGEISAPAVYSPGVLSESAYEEMIWSQMGKIEDNPEYKKLIVDNYKAGGMGYTQTLANNAIKDLKASGQMPMHMFGDGLWGQADWVRANYPTDEYRSYLTEAPTTLQPGYGIPVLEQEPVIKVAQIIPAIDPNPGAVNNTVPAASAELNDGPVIKPDYLSLIEIRMNQIRRDPVYIKLIQDNYLNGKMGYTQTIAANAIKDLKESGAIPIDQFGEGLWGQAEWVRANWAPDKYTAPAVPIIEAVDPNPGANAINTGTAATKPADVIPVEQKADQEIIPSALIPDISTDDTKISLVKIVLVVLAIIILIKIISK